MSCANVRESIQLLLRYGHVLFRPSWEVHELEGGLVLRAQITKGTARQQQFLAELLSSNLIAVGRALYGNKVERSKGPKFSSPTNSQLIQPRIIKLLRPPRV